MRLPQSLTHPEPSSWWYRIRGRAAVFIAPPIPTGRSVSVVFNDRWETSGACAMKCWCGGKVFTDMKLDPPEYRCSESRFHAPFATGRPEVIKKLYIAGPMSGYPDCNYPAFHEAARRLQDVGYETVNPADVHVDRCHYTDLIREDLRVMLDCHGVATLDDWWESTGARNEVNVAGVLKMPVRPLEEWMSLAYQEQAREIRIIPDFNQT